MCGHANRILTILLLGFWKERRELIPSIVCIYRKGPPSSILIVGEKFVVQLKLCDCDVRFLVKTSAKRDKAEFMLINHKIALRFVETNGGRGLYQIYLKGICGFCFGPGRIECLLT